MISQPTTRDSEGLLEQGHLTAARRLISSVARDYVRLVSGKEGLDAAFQQWEALFRELRKIEQKRFIERAASKRELSNHRKIVNLLVFGADMIASAAERHIESNHHPETAEIAETQKRVRMIRQHGSLLSFEFAGWHGAESGEKASAKGRPLSVKA